MDDPVSTFNEENLTQVVIDLFLGGTDTTATTLRWALIYMVQHGAIQGEGLWSHPNWFSCSSYLLGLSDGWRVSCSTHWSLCSMAPGLGHDLSLRDRQCGQL